MQLIPIDYITIGIWVGVICVTLGIFLILLHKYLSYSETNKNQLAFCIMFFCLGLSRIFLLYFDYFLTELNPAEYINYATVWKVATSFLLIGVGFLILVSEHALWKGKDYFLFFIGFAIVVTLSMIVPNFELSQTLSTAAIGFAAFIILSYLYLAYKLPQARKNTMLMLLGLIIYGVALILVSVFIAEPSIIHWLYFCSALIQIPGLLLFGFGVKCMYFSE
ncbi:MAG: hypothetical protein ACTSQI_15535 [Candidatus Helarchaeota archaeon]